MKKTVDVNIGSKDKPKLIKVGAWLTEEERNQYKALLSKFGHAVA